MIAVHILKHVPFQNSPTTFIHHQRNIVILPFTQHHALLIPLPQLLHYLHFRRSHEAATRASRALRTYHVKALPTPLIIRIII